MKTLVTPKVLKWARKTSGYEIKDIIGKLSQKRITTETIIAWEAGKDAPTYPQLRKLSKFYSRPIALFFLPEPPKEDEETSIKAQFRSLPSSYIDRLAPALRHLIREALVKRINLKEIYNNSIPKDIQSFKAKLKDISINNPKKLAEKIREILGITIEQQFSWRNSDEALKNWRHKLETLGIWVFKAPFKDEDYSGFYLNDDDFPIIYLNNGEVKERQIFSLFHELGHFLLGKGGIDFRSDIQAHLSAKYRKEEVFCNVFAGAFLVPDSCLSRLYSSRSIINDNSISEVAKKCHVSKAVIWRRYFDNGLVARQKYENFLREDQTRGSSPKRIKTDGGNYYGTQKSYLGHKYLHLVFNEYYQQRINQEQLADYLQVKIKSIPTLEGFFLKESS